MASLNMRALVVGEQPEGYDVGDAYHHILMTILVAARAHGVAAVDGPYLKVRDVEAFRKVAGRSAALGYDGKWVLHPDQIAVANDVFSPRQDEYDRAEVILQAYDWHTSRAGGARWWRRSPCSARPRSSAISWRGFTTNIAGMSGTRRWSPCAP
jgi:citrate lyase subunit beta/citryl-CoA lyase